MTLRTTLLAAGFLVATSFAGFAAAQSATAALQGEGKPGDVAIIQNTGTGVSREIKVKDNGRYALRNLPTGTYSVVVRHADGSMDAARIVTLQVGSTARVQ